MRAQRTPITAAAAVAVALGLTLAGCTASDDPHPNDDGPPAPTASQSSGESTTGSGTERGAALATTAFALAWRDAVDTAKDGFEGELTEIELGWETDRYAYTVELLSGDHEHTAVVDAETGEVVTNSGEPVENNDVAEKKAEVIDYEGLVPLEEAMSTALDAQSGTVSEWKLEGTQNGAQWQFDINAGSGEDYEVTVDAYSGDVITTDD
ncbi:PepSY domain-containing protein [Paramicrobacterium agarici]|uniref:PepSY domain-containing protein n=1 Tax=Paramicrobacterium agarici TaxID=630514 RepID=UPI001153960E|nr:PepSY domain-containing protein [Microbacterium agarici]TQO22337.1 putative membrane protein YkoI [Microbacterium agarici]